MTIMDESASGSVAISELLPIWQHCCPNLELLFFNYRTGVLTTRVKLNKKRTRGMYLWKKRLGRAGLGATTG